MTYPCISQEDICCMNVADTQFLRCLSVLLTLVPWLSGMVALVTVHLTSTVPCVYKSLKRAHGYHNSVAAQRNKDQLICWISSISLPLSGWVGTGHPRSLMPRLMAKQASLSHSPSCVWCVCESERERNLGPIREEWSQWTLHWRQRLLSVHSHYVCSVQGLLSSPFSEVTHTSRSIRAWWFYQHNCNTKWKTTQRNSKPVVWCWRHVRCEPSLFFFGTASPSSYSANPQNEQVCLLQKKKEILCKHPWYHKFCPGFALRQVELRYFCSQIWGKLLQHPHITIFIQKWPICVNLWQIKWNKYTWSGLLTQAKAQVGVVAKAALASQSQTQLKFESLHVAPASLLRVLLTKPQCN